ncbi:MAG: Sec-independent protein translocase protein TatB [Gammaproteobacteria bacterium]|nr:Sec-independent protein translocase protein TatB [Gammaproteobacteria bacterium]
MFDIGFLELLVCAVIALIVLGPERLPHAARTLGRWVGRARRMVRHFTDEVDKQLKAEELRERIRAERSAIGIDDIQQSVQSALDEARQFEHMLVKDTQGQARASAESPATPQDRESGATDSCPQNLPSPPSGNPVTTSPQPLAEPVARQP